MVKLEKAVTARYEHQGEHFEILVDPDLAMDLKKGKNVNFNDLMAIDTIFKDAGKGEAASEEKIKNVFGTDELEPAVKKIITEGTVQLTTEQRKKMREQRYREVVQLISTNVFDPKTSSPHPPQRIENAMAEAKISIDVLKTANEQMPAILNELKKLIPISTEKIRVAIRVPAQFAAKASSVIHAYPIKKQEWQRDGSLIAIVEVSPGLKNDLFNELNHLTHGDVETKLLKEGENF